MPGAEVIEVHLHAGGSIWEGVQIVRLRGREEVSSLFSFDLEVVVAPGATFEGDDVLGREVDLVFSLGGEERRRVHGIIAGIDDLLRSESAHRELRLQVRSRFERLALVETQEIYVDLTVPEVVTRKLELGGFVADHDFRFALSGSYPKREVVVQYRETDLAFVSRLTEHLGISFYLEHVSDDDGETWRDRLVFTDRTADFPVKDHGIATRFEPKGERQGITALESRRRIMPAFWAVQDYNERIPTVDLYGIREVAHGDGGGVIDYAPNALTPEEARHLVDVRAEEREALCRHHVGEAHLPEIAAGARFELQEHPVVADGTGFLVVAVEHELSQSIGVVGRDAAVKYRNTFRAVLSSTSFRPARRTPKPRIPGILPAVVAPLASGVPGATAPLDHEGRYRLRFHFDTSPADRTMPSHPIRQIQSHAGPGYGTHFPLKPETEVQVAFLDGDPDRPVIVGAVPNAVTPSPVVARDATKHRIQTAAGVLIEMGERPGAR